MLMIEDNAENRDIDRTILEHRGYTVLEASNRRTGAAPARWHVPDLILMDIQMPAMDGLGATRLLKVDPLTAAIHVVAVTARMLRPEEGSDRAEFAEFILKPIVPLQLVDVVGRVLGRPPRSWQA